MKRPYLLTLIPIGLALGYGVGQLVPPATFPSIADPAPDSHQLSPAPLPSDLRQLWRARFLKILEEPSFSLQSASYYAVAQDLSLPDKPYFLEAMYPEGWTRFRGDLPLALYMEWAERDPASLAPFTEHLLNTYPDLEDNLDGVFFNLGLQNRSSALRTIEAIDNEEHRRFLAVQFIEGIRLEHPEQLFPTRLRLLGPQETYADLSPAELSQAASEYWDHPESYPAESIAIDSMLALEIGRRYRSHGIQRLANTFQQATAIVGSIVATGSASEAHFALLLERPSNWGQVSKHLSQSEQYTLLSFLSKQEEFWSENSSHFSADIINNALDREIAARLLRLPHLAKRIQSYVLAHAARLYSKTEFTQLIGELDADAGQRGLLSMIQTASAAEGSDLLAQIPAAWRSEQVINAALEHSLRKGDVATFEALRSQYPESKHFLPRDSQIANALWQTNPELYLSSIESLHGYSKANHLKMIAASAAEEELSMILESGTFDQQTDVLISLIHEMPYLSTEILKHEDPALINPQQATQIGGTLAYGGMPETTLSYFGNVDLSHNSSQLSLLQYFLTENNLGATPTTSLELAQLSPQHDYLYRTATSLQQDSEDPEPLLALRQENPETFIRALTAVVSNHPQDSLKQRTKRLLSSPQLSTAEKLQIHNALYGAPSR
ncbi:hypothetical protein [Pelagicoccus sp. SDUM812005]|uniref:hypothetical protein n=1 Tax=Pelagicoccus sp. SDUM812005 TaxID=3041257 RepID=UPI00280D4D28|nr:hypothetical protein [Pelagicoccus sp. SDUM812005]MDQ8181248.1 hypothetical protein [Pelagicoccus sp. SDUM812005]